MKLRFQLAATLCVLILTQFTTAAASPAPGSSLRLFTQRGYLPANPALVRVEVLAANGLRDIDLWDADALLSASAGVTLSTNRIPLRNGLGSGLVTFSGGGNFTLTVTVDTLSTNKALTTLAAVTPLKVSGTLAGSATTWSNVVHVTNNLTVPAGHTLTILSNTLILLHGAASGTTGAVITVLGQVHSLGTEDQPVTFTCTNAAMNWGEIRHTNATLSAALLSTYRNTLFTKAGRAPAVGHTGSGPMFRLFNSSNLFDNCVLSDNVGKVMDATGSDLLLTNCQLARSVMGPEINGSALHFRYSHITDMFGTPTAPQLTNDNDGIYLHSQQGGQIITLRDSVFSGGHDDAIDTLGASITVTNCILRDWPNPNEDAKGISGFNGTVNIRRSLFVNCYVGVAMKTDAGTSGRVNISESTVIGITRGLDAVFKANAPGPIIDFRVTNCIVRAPDAIHTDFGPTNFTIGYSDLTESWPGTGNLTANPLFADEPAWNFRLWTGSPCIDAGDPAGPADPDASRNDIGFFPYAAASATGTFIALTAPNLGDVFTAPTNISLAASAQSTTGTLSKVEFYQGATKLGEDATDPYGLTWNNVPPGLYTLTAVAIDTTGFAKTSAPVSITVNPGSGATSNVLVSLGSVWKYLDNGSDQGTGWVAPAFDDSTWASGPAQLGYGDGDEATVVNGGPSAARIPTTYFRRAFNATGTSSVTNLGIRLLRDDGGAIYLNGVEIYRTSNLPPGAAYNTYCSGNAAPENILDVTNLAPAGLLLEGPNVVAVEIHQQSPNSSDVSFDFELVAVGEPSTNNRPLVSVTAPLAGTIFGTPANFTITAAASDSDGAVTNVAFLDNGAKLGDDTVAPFSFDVVSLSVGAHSLAAVATDNVGLSTTSSIVAVTVSANIAAPVVFAKSPVPGSVMTLTGIVVTFSKDVIGVNAADLLVNGVAASGLSGSGSNYTFGFPQPAYGAVAITWAGAHGIIDLFTPSHAFATNSAGANWTYTLLDAAPPVMAALNPVASATVASLTNIAVTFSEAVSGVNATDLRVNGVAPATLTGSGAGPYTFHFTQPAPGPVTVNWITGHGIIDAAGNAFAGGTWSYSLDTNATGIVINEIMFHPSNESTNEEWIEIHNRGAVTVNLAGWRLSAGVQFTFPSVSIAGGGYLVMCADTNAFAARYPGVSNIVGNWAGFLNNSGEDIDIDNAAGSRVDSVRYADEGDWAVRQRGPDDQGQRGWIWFKPHDGLGKTLELISAAMPNGSGQNWAPSGPTDGTPGAANSVLTANIAPLVLEVTHFPVVPRSTDSPAITARILDEAAGSVTVTLHHRVSAASPPAFGTATMRDDGAGGDAAGGDGIFTAQLAPQANSAIVEFYVRAVDFQGNARTWPAPAIAAPDGTGPTGQVANAFYQIDDTPYNATNNQPLYKLIMTVAENAQLAGIPCSGSQGTYAQMNMTFITVEESGSFVNYLAGARNRGNGSRCANPPNYRVNFPSDSLWKGVSGININSVNPYIQHIGSVAARKAGADGSATRAVRVRVNNLDRAIAGSPMFGSYAAVEPLNGDWASAHYPLDGNGNVYRVNRNVSPPDFSYRGETPSSYQNTWFKESNASENDWSDLVGMLRVAGINNATPFTTENVRQVINVEQWLRHLAVMNLLGNAESGLNTGYNDDYYKYRGVVDPRFLLTYHDLDSVLGVASLGAGSGLFTATANLGSGQAMDRLLNWPDFQPLYYQTLLDLVNGVYAQANFDALVDQTLGGYVEVGAINSIKGWMAQRRASVLSQIPAFTVSNAPIATVTGRPRSPTPFGTATLTVGGSNVVSYKFNLNGGAFGAETPVATPISLSGLANGANTVAVIGMNALGLWQAESNATALAWVVNSAWPAVRLNEVLARNDTAVNHSGTFPDLIELFNEGGASVSLAGLRLSDDAANPAKFTFPPGTMLASGGYLVVFANNPDATPGFHTGFTLDAEGEGVYLFDSVANGGALLDSVVFGIQLPNLAIGRVSGSGDWRLTTPTSGAANSVRALGSQTGLKINEWLASGLNPYPDDFIELYNANTNPVALGGLFLTDRTIGTPVLSPIAPLSFIAGSGYQVFTADGGNGNTHVIFRLAAEQGEIGLTRPRGGNPLAATLPPHLGGGHEIIDCVIYGPQRTDIASGRCPDGSPTLREMVSATPGVPNACPFAPPAAQTIVFLNYTNEWRYDQTGADLGTAWKETNYNDAAWPSGQGLFGFDTVTFLDPTNTTFQLSTTKTTFYFRVRFNIPAGTTISGLQVTEYVDDGAIYYLNGQECRRIGMPGGAVNAAMFASSSVGDAVSAGPFPVPMTNLLTGDNVLAVEVHQITATSGDLIFGCKLEGVIATNSPAAAGVLINEILANNATLEEPDGSKPDWVEIYNPSSNTVDLAGMALTDDLAQPQRWVFPAGSLLVAQGYFKVRLDADLLASATNAGFGLKANGGVAHLINRPADGGSVANTIAYGLQAADFSIGRVPAGSTNLILTTPSFGGPNFAATLGNPALLKVNEWMAYPASGEDWFEIYNPSAQPVNVSRFYLSDDVVNRTKGQLPALSFIGAGPYGFMKFDADNTVSPPDHVPFRLNNAGEAVVISGTNGAVIDAISFGPQTQGVSQGRLTDGTANIVPFPLTATPGRPNFLPLADLVINEVLTHSDPPLEDAVEIFNLTGDDVNIGGWYLSDGQNNLLKYRIPSNSIVPANGYAVFYEGQFNFDNQDVPFSFNSAKGDDIYLSQSTAPGVLTGYRAVAEFGAAANGVSFGRFPTSVGEDFTAMGARTFGQDNPATTNQFRTGTGLTNVYPKVGPVVFNEIMYHPPGTNDALEFVELHNILGVPVPLYDLANPLNTWRVRKGIDFNFPTGVVMQAGGFLVLVNFDPLTDTISLAAFQAAYGSNVTLLGPYAGKLANSGEDIELQKPDAPQTVPGPDFGYVPRIVVDRVVYGTIWPWPPSPDGFGDSLKKLTASLYGNEGLNWDGGAPTPGAANMTGTGTNTPPVLAAIGNKVVFEQSLLSFTASATDADAPPQILAFSLDPGAPAGAGITPGGAFTWLPSEAQGPGAYAVTIRVADNGSPAMSDSETITITVNETNAAPSLVPIGNKIVAEGATVTFAASAGDSDLPAQTLVFSLDPGAPPGAGIGAVSGAFSWATTEADGPGAFNVTVRVTDNGTPARSAFETITITVNEVNSSPSLLPIADRTVNEGATISFNANASDPDLPAQALTFTLAGGAPAGAGITAGGAFTWVTTEAQGPGTNVLRVIVTDNGTPSLTATQSFSVVVSEVNVAPVLAAITSRTVNEGTLVTFTNSVTDSDLPANTLTFSLEPGAPSGTSVNSSNGVFTWTPSEAQGPGSNVVRVIVTDNGSPSLTATQSFSVVVNEVNLAPVLAAIPATNIVEGSSLSFTATATDADLPANTLLFTLGSGAPAGAGLTAGGVFTWTPAEDQGPATNTIRVIVTDNGSPSLTATQTFVVTVSELNLAPMLAAISDRTISEGTPLSITNSATDPDLPAQTLTFSLGAGFPSGASVNSGSGVFVWTPSEAQGPGIHPIRVIVADNGTPSLTATQSFTVTVNEVNLPPVLGAIGNKSGTNGFLVTFTATAIDPDLPANARAFSLDSGAPAGASIDANSGVFSWTPTLADAGAHSVTVRVTDNGAPSLEDFETITVTVTLAPLKVELASVTNLWRYNQSGSNLFTAWRSNSFNDSSWPAGNAVLYNESNLIPAPTNTFLALSNAAGVKITNYYFRTRFWLAAATSGVVLTASNLLDDGAVIYLNGAEAARINMPTGNILATTFAATSVEATNFFTTNILATSLVMGENLIAVEVHQQSATSSDVVFALALSATLPGQLPVSITTQPTNLFVASGQPAQFTAAATGSAPQFQWFRNGVPIPGANSATYSIASSTTNDAGTFSVVVSNYVSMATSGNAVLAVDPPPNTPPTVSNITDQNINEDGTAGPLAFTIGDTETPASSLTLSKTSTDTALVPEGNIVFGGSGANRTVTVTPLADQSGTTLITVSVSDGQFIAQDTFLLTVAPVNDVPVISAIADQSIPEDGATVPLVFTISDVETSASSLTVSATSTNTTLVPNANILLGGTGGSRTVTVTPAPNGFGTTRITLRVDDGAATNSRSFLVTVTPVNDTPTISAIADQAIDEDTATAGLVFTIGDVETAAGSLTVTRASTNTLLVPVSNIVLGGSGSNRTVTITPATNQSGMTLITLTVSDGTTNAGASFLLTVNAVNDPPVISAIAGQFINEDGASTALPFTIGDAESAVGSLAITADSTNTTLVPNANVVVAGSGTNRTVTVTPAANASGVTRITLTVSDGSASTQAGFLVTVNPLNDAPTLAAVANQIIAEGSTLTVSNSASDIDLPSQTLTFSLGAGAPAGASLNSSGVFTWTPAEAQGPSSNTVRVIVTDNGSPSLTATQFFGIVVTELNVAPVLPTIANRTIAEGVTLILTNTASDTDLPANTITYSLDAGAPSGAGIGATSGVFNWMPTEAQAPLTAVLRIIATDNGVPSLSVTQSFTVTVTEANTAPTLAPVANWSILTGGTLTFTNTAFDADLPLQALTFTLDAGAPAGASVHPVTGVFTYTAPATFVSLTNQATLRVTDNGTPPLAAIRTFSIVVEAAPRILFISVDGSGVVTITWESHAGRKYRLRSAVTVTATTWTNVGGEVTATGSSTFATDTTTPGQQRFYRVLLVE